MRIVKTINKKQNDSVKHFFSSGIINRKSNSHTPIGKAYMQRRLPEVHHSPANLVALQNAWVPLGQFLANCSLIFAFSVTPMCEISCFRWDGVHNKLSYAQLSTWSKNIFVQFVTFEY